MEKAVKTGLEAVTQLQAAFEAAGLMRASSAERAALTGWTERLGGQGFSIRKRPDDTLCWTITISGKPHLRYSEHQMLRNGEVVTTHAPIGPERATVKMFPVCEELGLDVFAIMHRGHSTFHDFDVEYEIWTTHPDWLEPYRLRQKPAYPHRGILY